VGEATARATARPVDLIPTRHSAAGLAAEFPAGTGRVLLVGPEGDRSDLAGPLRAKGWTVEEVAAYRTVPAEPSSADLLRALSADAVLFASGSAVRSWATVFGSQVPAVVIVIGPSTSQVAAQVGLKVDGVAADQTLDELVGCLVAYFSSHV
jgi:uroporphyrinogen-III synthase